MSLLFTVNIFNTIQCVPTTITNLSKCYFLLVVAESTFPALDSATTLDSAAYTQGFTGNDAEYIPEHYYFTDNNLIVYCAHLLPY